MARNGGIVEKRKLAGCLAWKRTDKQIPVEMFRQRFRRLVSDGKKKAAEKMKPN